MKPKHVKIVMIGAFPPPIHGMAVINEIVHNQLLEETADLLKIDLAAPSLNRNLFARLKRIPKIAYGLWVFLLIPDLNKQVLYMSVSGGLGQIYELFFLFVARLHHMQIILNHHSFAYLQTHHNITELLTRVAGVTTIHTVQSLQMAKRLSFLYKRVERVVPISNATFLLPKSTSPIKPRQQLRTLGFLSNITEEKGIFLFLELMNTIQSKKLPIKARLAGPFQDIKTEKEVRARLKQLKNTEYIGAKYGEDKESFFASIDVFIFPTLYKNETEGIVNHEAMSYGIPVIAYGRGCIPEFIKENNGLAVPPENHFVPIALEKICDWFYAPLKYQEASITAYESFKIIQLRSSLSWKELKEQMLENNFKIPSM